MNALFGMAKKRTSAEILARLMEFNPDLQTKLFQRKLWSAVKKTFGEDEEDLDAEWFQSRVSFVPDAYLLDAKRRRLTIIEIEVTNRLSPDKLQAIAHLLFDLRLWDWNSSLIRVDEYGRLFREDWFSFMNANANPKPARTR